MRHYGMRGFGAFGAVDFDSASVWANWKSGDQALTAQAAKTIQAKLNELGYASPPLVVDGVFGDKSMTAYCAMLTANGAPKDIDGPGGKPCWPGPKGLAYMDTAKPGTNVTPMCKGKTGEWIPCAGGGGGGTSKAGLGFGGMLAIGIGIAALVGVAALMAKKKKAGGEPTKALANGRRRRRRARKNFSKAEWREAKKAIKAMSKKRRSRRRR